MRHVYSTDSTVTRRRIDAIRFIANFVVRIMPTGIAILDAIRPDAGGMAAIAINVRIRIRYAGSAVYWDYGRYVPLCLNLSLSCSEVKMNIGVC